MITLATVTGGGDLGLGIRGRQAVQVVASAVLVSARARPGPDPATSFAPASLRATSWSEGLTHLLRTLELRGTRSDADEVHHVGIARVRIGVAGHAVAAHALREPQTLRKGLLVLRGCWHATWEQPSASLISRDVLR